MEAFLSQTEAISSSHGLLDEVQDSHPCMRDCSHMSHLLLPPALHTSGCLQNPHTYHAFHSLEPAICPACPTFNPTYPSRPPSGAFLALQFWWAGLPVLGYYITARIKPCRIVCWVWSSPGHHELLKGEAHPEPSTLQFLAECDAEPKIGVLEAH